MAEGKLFALDGCSHEARGAATPPPGCTTAKGRMVRPPPNRDVADSASPRDGFTGSFPDADKVNTSTTSEKAPATACGDVVEAWCGSSMTRPSEVSVILLRDVRTTNRQRQRRHAFAQPAAASRGVAPTCPRPLRRGTIKTLLASAGNRLLYHAQGMCNLSNVVMGDISNVHDKH